MRLDSTRPGPLVFISHVVASREHLSQNLAEPIHTKDGGTLRTIQDACAYMGAISKEREQLPHWQHVRKLILEEPDVTALSWQFRLAVLKDAKVDVSKTPAE